MAGKLGSEYAAFQVLWVDTLSRQIEAARFAREFLEGRREQAREAHDKIVEIERWLGETLTQVAAGAGLTRPARPMAPINAALLDEDDAHELFTTIRWAASEGFPVCPHCSSRRVQTLEAERAYACEQCSQRFSIMTGMMMAAGKLSLRSCICAMAKFASSPNGSSARDISQMLECDFRTAFNLVRRLRMIARLRTIGPVPPMVTTTKAIWQEGRGRIPYERRLAHLLFHGMLSIPRMKRQGHWRLR